jgi:hypothetical protein
MNTVSITEQPVSVVITSNGSSTVVEAPSTTVVMAVTAGPQGAAGPSGLVVDTAAKVDKSVVYYDAGAATFKADNIWTVITLTDGGNF